MIKATLGLLLLSTAASAHELVVARQAQGGNVDACPGYSVKNAKTSSGTFTADLKLAGAGCNAYGTDLQNLKLAVTYENGAPVAPIVAEMFAEHLFAQPAQRIHVKIIDADSKRYEIPESVFPRPTGKAADSKNADIKFSYTSSPFSFTIYRGKTKEVLFDSSAGALVFEPQYLRLKTKLPSNANIYGLGEHTDTFRLDPTNTTRTFWNRDAYGLVSCFLSSCQILMSFLMSAALLPGPLFTVPTRFISSTEQLVPMESFS